MDPLGGGNDRILLGISKKKIFFTDFFGKCCNQPGCSSVILGEQEILVLFYKLIFESDVNLLLIDEPEISLHIAWQKELMENLKSIVNLKKNIQVIIATHSPQIISHNWDLQIDLGGLHNG